MASNAEEALRANDLDGALEALQADIRQQPQDRRLRVFLFQLLAVRGEWQRALKQLDLLVEMDTQYALFAQTCRALIAAEATRARVFAGEAPPALLGEPQAWAAKLIEALSHDANGRPEAASSLRSAALDEAAATPGRIDDRAAGWIADADPRLGPVLEAVVNAHYLWVPFERISRVELEPVADLRDFVWLPAKFTWRNQGDAVGFVPLRYVASERRPDAAVRLAQTTEWVEPAPGAAAIGYGQRMLTTDTIDIGLLECRAIELDGEGPVPAHG